MMVRLPTSTDSFTHIGVNGVVNAEINFVPNIATFSVPIANATVGGKFGTSTTADDEVYFSANITSQGFADALPDLTIVPSASLRSSLFSCNGGETSATVRTNSIQLSMSRLYVISVGTTGTGSSLPMGHSSLGIKSAMNRDRWHC